MRHVFTVPKDGAGQRLDRWLRTRLGDPALTRSRLQALIRAGAVQLNGQPARAGLRLRPNDLIEIELPEQVPLGALEPEPFTLNVLYEDEYIIAIDKPSGMVVYPAAGHPCGTVINQLISYCGLASFGAPYRPGIVHRLDEGTSGVLLVAKTDLAYLKLVEQFKSRELEKRYLALVHGRVAEDEGRIEGPIGRDPARRQRMRIIPRGKPAITEFRVIKRGERTTLLEVRPLTGRTHQIRVHLSAIGHPVVGDDVYGSRSSAREGRLMLHAWQMKLTHPITAERLELVAPLPREFLQLIECDDDIIAQGCVREHNPKGEHGQRERGEEGAKHRLEQNSHQSC